MDSSGKWIPGIYSVPHKYQNAAQGLFNMGDRCRAITQTHPAAPKMPQKGAPHVPGDKPSPVGAGESQGHGSLRPMESQSYSCDRNAVLPWHPCQVALTNSHKSQDTSNLHHVPGNTATQSVLRPVCQDCKKCWPAKGKWIPPPLTTSKFYRKGWTHF